MSGFEWFLLVVVVIAVPLVVAVAITLWTLEQAKQRNRKNREVASGSSEPVKRRATRDDGSAGAIVPAAAVASMTHHFPERTARDPHDHEFDPSPSSDSTPVSSPTSSSHASSNDSGSGNGGGSSGGDGGSGS